MNSFQPGDRILFLLGAGEHIGTIERPDTIADAPAYLVNGPDAKPGPWLVFAEDVIPIPDGVPILAEGDRVQVAADAPTYAGRVGTVEEPATRNGMVGYWLLLHRDGQPLQPAWVPAEALTVLAMNGGEPR